MSLNRRNVLKLAGGLVTTLVLGRAGYAATEYVFSAVPQFTPPQVFKEWQPLLKRLTLDTGIGFTIRTYDSIPKFEEAFKAGEIDLAYMNPYHAVMARKAQHYVPLVRDSDELNGILLVRKDGPQKIEELSGKALGFPAPNAFGASLYMRALLKEKHGIDFESRWLQTHSNVYRHIITGDIVAGGSVQRAFDSEPKTVRDELKVIFETPGVAPHPIVAHPRIPVSDRAKLIGALLKLRATDDGKALLKAVRMPGLVEADYARDYLPLENLKLEKYVGANK